MPYTFQAAYLKVLAWATNVCSHPTSLYGNRMEINEILIVFFSQKNISSNRRTTITNRENFPYMESNYNKGKMGKMPKRASVYSV